jgi:hypothetical protein
VFLACLSTSSFQSSLTCSTRETLGVVLRGRDSLTGDEQTCHRNHFNESANDKDISRSLLVSVSVLRERLEGI